MSIDFPIKRQTLLSKSQQMQLFFLSLWNHLMWIEKIVCDISMSIFVWDYFCHFSHFSISLSLLFSSYCHLSHFFVISILSIYLWDVRSSILPVNSKWCVCVFRYDGDIFNLMCVTPIRCCWMWNVNLCAEKTASKHPLPTPFCIHYTYIDCFTR